jgi:hypothetical protein
MFARRGPPPCCRLVALVLALGLLAGATYLYVLWRYGWRLVSSMPGSPVRDFRLAPRHGLLLCTIEKAANSALCDLACSLERTGAHARWWDRLAAQVRTPDGFELGCTWNTANAATLGLSDADVWRAFRHGTAAGQSNWTSAVFVRDPLERFLSGYISKCTDGHDPDRYICRRVFGRTDAPFASAVATMGRAAAAGADLPRGAPEDHFRLQSSFCGGAVGRGEFDRTYVLERTTSHATVGELLRAVGVAEPEAVPAYAYHFPRAGEALHQTYANGEHMTDAHSAARRAEYYGDGPEAAELVRTLLRFYAPDYAALPLQVPAWAVAKSGEEFVRSLGLKI